MTTVGYGTRTPKTELGKVMVMVYGLIGIVLIGLFVSILTKKFTLVVQKFDDFYKNNPVCYRLGNNFFVSWFLLFNFVQLVVPALVFYGMEKDVYVNKTEKSKRGGSESFLKIFCFKPMRLGAAVHESV